MIYNTLDRIPKWAFVTVNQMVSTGLIQCKDGTFEFPLSDEMLYIFVILSRSGIILHQILAKSQPNLRCIFERNS